jgi:putative Mg2+ transporter-C (MgtC) family protein
MEVHDQFVLFGRIALATGLGYLIGLEREYWGKNAGDRTFALLALGSAAFVGLGVEMFPLTADRVIQGVAAGVGFLGAGIIFRGDQDGGPRGLTTAAASWAVAAIGALAGAGVIWTPIMVTALVIVLLESQRLSFIRRIGEKHRTPPPNPSPE